MMDTEVHPSGDRSTMMLEGWRSRCARGIFIVQGFDELSVDHPHMCWRYEDKCFATVSCSAKTAPYVRRCEKTSSPFLGSICQSNISKRPRATYIVSTISYSLMQVVSRLPIVFEVSH